MNRNTSKARDLRDEKSEIEYIRQFHQSTPAMKLAKMIKEGTGFPVYLDNAAAAQCTGRTLLSIYSVIRRWDAANKAITVVA